MVSVFGDVGEIVLKADIEGEPLAFKGAEKLIDRHSPTILCEINPWYLAGFGKRCEDLCDWLSAKGYQLHRLEPAQRRLLRVEQVADIIEANYLFVHPRRLDRLSEFLAEEAPLTRGSA